MFESLNRTERRKEGRFQAHIEPTELIFVAHSKLAHQHGAFSAEHGDRSLNSFSRKLPIARMPAYPISSTKKFYVPVLYYL